LAEKPRRHVGGGSHTREAHIVVTDGRHVSGARVADAEAKILQINVVHGESPTNAGMVAGLYILMQMLEACPITPLIQKKMVDLPPVLTIAAQVIFAALFGVPGVVLAAPLTVVAMALGRMLYLEDVLGDEAP